jgi:hypothetical protein
MALPNNDPVYSKAGSFGQSMILKAAAADYTGVSPYNREVWVADATNGGYLQRLRFKALGANVATVARIYINRGGANTNFAVAPAAPTGTPSAAGGTMLTGNYYACVIAIGPNGQQSVIGAFSTIQAVTGPTGSIGWAWTAVAGATSYRIYVSPWSTGTTYATFATRYFTSATNSYTQTQVSEMGTFDDPTVGNQFLYGEVSLPLISAASATAAMADIDYPMNLALPAGYEVYVGLGTAVAAGWACVGVGGSY